MQRRQQLAVPGGSASIAAAGEAAAARQGSANGAVQPAVVTNASLKLLAGGYLIGASLGFVLGVAIGWSKAVGYWAHPVLRFVGPLPATAWLPLAFFVFPSSWSASTFLIALATGFPVTVLTCLLGLTNGYLTSVLMIMAPKAVPLQHSETAGIVIVLFLVVGLAVGSVVSWFWVI